MEIKKILKEYDALFRHATPEEIQRFLADKICMAEKEADNNSLLTLLNEQIGFARETDKRDIALSSCRKLRGLLQTMNLYDTIPYGNSMLNIANTSRKFMLYEEAAASFQEAEHAYRVQLPEEDYAFAGLYNNWSILAMEQHQYKDAVMLIRRSMNIIDRYDKAVIKQATSRVNLAVALNALAGNNESVTYCEEARSLLDDAIQRFEHAGGQDYHYSGALAALADMQFADGNYIEAAKNYEHAVYIIKMYMGSNSIVCDLLKKKQLALDKMNGTEEFYE